MAKLGPHGHSRLAAFLQKRILELRSVKKQSDIAAEAGFKSANMITMIKQGTTRLPLDRVASLARALEVDPKHLFLLALEQEGQTTTNREIQEIFGTVVTANELGWIEAVREASNLTDPPCTKRARTAIRGLFGR